MVHLYSTLTCAATSFAVAYLPHLILYRKSQGPTLVEDLIAHHGNANCNKRLR